ncbi:unnamed protein product [Adineta ricciae]|uniref:inorganic diphosphatase n=1 Tax=Adineta ricciae TaxID=249248 RepID=A0A814VM87_ADIRI|nr:unnamed protein product [Adineta ricciae]CAF1222548.1 unnamed protein product [Adineta ricciae]
MVSFNWQLILITVNLLTKFVLSIDRLDELMFMNLLSKRNLLTKKVSNNQNQLFIFGHINPDTDAVVSALVFADYLRRQKINAKAYRLGDLNNETKFVLQKAGVKPPELLPDDLPEGTSVALVDHNESQQSMVNLTKMHVKYVVDHHKLGDLTTTEPVYLRFEPMGSTATILTKLYRENKIHISKKIATLLLSAILSDTLQFRSSTTTNDDRLMLNYLLSIARIVDVNSYANEMFTAKSDLTGYSIEQILLLDYKTFIFNDQVWGIGFAETFNSGYILNRKDELISAMLEEKKKNNITGILFSIIDIAKIQNFMIIPGELERSVIEEAFNVDIQNGIADLGSRISRKKNIVPTLESYFKLNN